MISPLSSLFFSLVLPTIKMNRKPQFIDELSKGYFKVKLIKFLVDDDNFDAEDDDEEKEYEEGASALKRGPKRVHLHRSKRLCKIFTYKISNNIANLQILARSASCLHDLRKDYGPFNFQNPKYSFADLFWSYFNPYSDPANYNFEELNDSCKIIHLMKKSRGIYLNLLIYNL